MVVTWNKEAIERIISALLAASPGFTPDYALMAQYFGQNTTYDSMQGRFRHYRKVADKMRADNPGLSASTRTPSRRTGGGTPSSRHGSGRVTKSTKQQKSPLKFEELTPSKSSKVCGGVSMHESIVIDDDDDGINLKEEVGVEIDNFSTRRSFRDSTIKPEPSGDGFHADIFKRKSTNGTVTVDRRTNGYVTDQTASSNYRPASVHDENDSSQAPPEYNTSFHYGFSSTFGQVGDDDDMI